MRITHLDHLVLTVSDIGTTCTFYEKALGLDVRDFGERRTALHFGRQKINLHQSGAEFEPMAREPRPGSADLCFIAEGSLDAVIERLREHGVPLIEGPVARTGATGPIQSVYFRDPDGNLIEVATPL